MRKDSVSKFEKKAVNNRHADFKCARGLQESALWSSQQARSASSLFFWKRRQCMSTVWDCSFLRTKSQTGKRKLILVRSAAPRSHLCF